MLITSFIAGFLGSLSPCVYPLIPITLSVMGARSHRSTGQSFLIACCYVSGMILLYTTLGILFASLGMLTGSAFQHPIFNLFLSLLMLAMALNLFGYFELALPHRFNTQLTQVGRQGGYTGAFLMGLVAGVLAAPCTGPILAAILAQIAEQKNLLEGSVYMFAYALGLGLPFLILAIFSSALNKLPKSGNWMKKIKMLLGVILLILSVYYAKLGVLALFTEKSPAYQAIETHIQSAQTQNKQVILDFWADWCTLCHKLDEVTLKSPQVLEALKAFEVIRVDVTVNSKETKVLQERYNIVGLPTLVFIDSGKKIHGFISPEDFIKVLNSAQN